MKKIKVKLLLLFVAAALSSCSIFKPGCKCPPVSYNRYPDGIKLAGI